MVGYMGSSTCVGTMTDTLRSIGQSVSTLSHFICYKFSLSWEYATIVQFRSVNDGFLCLQDLHQITLPTLVSTFWEPTAGRNILHSLFCVILYNPSKIGSVL